MSALHDRLAGRGLRRIGPRALLGAAFLTTLASHELAAADEPVATSGREEPEKIVLEEEEPSEESESAETEEKVPEASDSGRPSPFDARLGLRLYSRSFRYTDTLQEVDPQNVYGEPSSYNVAYAPMYVGHGDWFPAAHFVGGWPAHIGITGGYELGFGTAVVYQNRTIPQSHWLWFVGPKIRIPLDTHAVELFSTYGSHNFQISGDDLRRTPDGLVKDRPAYPDVFYQFIDVGLDARLRFDRLRVGAHAQYRIVLDAGQIATKAWYPNASASGVTFGGEVGWKLTEMFDILLGIDSLQYGLNFNPVPVDAPKNRVAGGATDRYISVWGGLQFVLPGDEPSAAAAPSGEKAPEKKPEGGGESFETFDEDF